MSGHPPPPACAAGREGRERREEPGKGRVEERPLRPLQRGAARPSGQESGFPPPARVGVPLLPLGNGLLSPQLGQRCIRLFGNKQTAGLPATRIKFLKRRHCKKTDSAHRSPSYSQSLIRFLPECLRTFSGMEEDKGQGAKATSGVGDLRKSWQTWAEDHIEYQRKNPFSSDDRLAAKAAHTHRGDPSYGRPPEGSRTEQRGKDAHSHVGKEVEELCSIIRKTGEVGEDGHVSVTFGQLFETYVTISNKVVGILLRARKHGLVHFEGEMLWQGKDDDVVITLLQ
ncbi:PREDICTED: actin-binding Rho-activating protein-like [Sturnus vulgaris]|uniref:actin-binding Rho-activating protein-like n=1 Tax=Sturnus vulgaris TaxID=9172 RepID=UPI00071A9AF5|nr:PREDICTED: actin-binding Rho-activating protein-like [Sturnus vulgaris]